MHHYIIIDTNRILQLKTTSFDLEPNPFERSFATEKESPNNGTGNNRHNLRIPNISNLNLPSKLPGITPTGFSSTDRKLPPLSLSPGGTSAPGTPVSMWNSLLSASNQNQNANQGHGQVQNPNANANQNQIQNGNGNANVLQNHQKTSSVGITGTPSVNIHQNAPGNDQHYNQNFNQFVSNLRKTGLTPNESNLRSGLTPGGAGGFPFGNQLPGLTTPSALLNSPMTPGLSSLLGITLSQLSNTNNNAHHPVPQQQVPPQLPPHQANLQGNMIQAPIMNNSGVINNMPTTIKEKSETKVSKKLENSKEPGANSNTSAPTTKKRKGNTEKNTANKKKKTEVKKEKASLETDSKSKKKKLEEDKENDNRDDEDNEINEGTTEEEKRKIFLERNRVAASKCRQRKKQLVQKMEDELSFYSTGYREVSAQMSQLRNHLLNLKYIIEGHKDCPVFLNSVGGFENFNNIVQQTNYLCQVTGNSANVSSIPSTIPTILNADHPAGGLAQQPEQQGQPIQPIQQGQPIQQQAQQQQQQQVPPPNGLIQSNPSTIQDPGSSQSGDNEVASHHSLPEVSQNGNSNVGDNGYIRNINSMTNLASANNQRVPGNGGVSVENGDFSLRPVVSMIDLQSQAQVQPQANRDSQQAPNGFDLGQPNGVIQMTHQ